MNRIIILLITLFFMSSSFAQFASKMRTGVGITYSTPLNEEFKNIAARGIGVSLCSFVGDDKGYGVGSIDYIRYKLPDKNEGQEIYYQIGFSGNAYGKTRGGFHALLGWIFIGYHNFPKKELPYNGQGLGYYFDELEKQNFRDWIGAKDKFFYFPSTFYSAGLGYEQILSQKVSIDISVKYNFNLLFDITSLQVTLSTAFF